MKTKIKPFAKALYEIAKEQFNQKDYLDLSLAIIDLLKNDNKILNYLGSYEVKFEDKKELIKELTHGFKYYFNWLCILVEQGNGRHIHEFINGYINIYNEKNGIVKGYAWTTEWLDIKVIEKLGKNISKKINKKVMFENRINKDLIGGIRLEVEDNVWDNTVKGKLMEILKKGSENNE
ncbi:MAG: ATP synthase subunit delta [Candidatus Tyloplasma litorale]|nr:MAG: ATP synthase subunit delta [Mycoplasmatales bacterium]